MIFYQHARDRAWQVLIRQAVRRLPVGVEEVCKREGYRVKQYSHPVIRALREDAEVDELFRGTDGLIFQQTIFYNDAASEERQRFTIAHELGHLILGHTYGQYNYYDKETETAADMFATRLLAPAVVLKEIGVTSAEEIQMLCGISWTAANQRWTRLKSLYARAPLYWQAKHHSCFCVSPLERQIKAQFAEFIEEKRIRYLPF